MKLKALYELIDGLAPFSVSEAMKALGHRDNSGLLVECGEEVRGILFSLDFSARAVEEAKRGGANVIVTHHPAIWDPVMHIGESPLAACIREGISVISAHLNLDCAEGGIDECLMRGLGGERALAFLEEVGGGRYGRVYDVAACSAEEFRAKIAAAFCTERILVYGEGTVRRVASFCGSGFDEEAIGFAIAHGADTFVSSDPKHHLITEAAERGLKVFVLTHYASENYGFLRFAERVRALVGVPVSTLTDERFL